LVWCNAGGGLNWGPGGTEEPKEAPKKETWYFCPDMTIEGGDERIPIEIVQGGGGAKMASGRRKKPVASACSPPNTRKRLPDVVVLRQKRETADAEKSSRGKKTQPIRS